MVKQSRYFCIPFIILFSLWLLPGAARADFAQRLNYQGRLTDANGVPVADAAGASMTFDICTDSNCTTVVWTETDTVDIEDGLFSATLGGTTALSTVNFDSTAYYIQVTYAGNTYTPPQRLTAAAMALNVRDSSITSAKVADNTLTAADMLVDVVSSVDGVTNDGGNIDLVAGGGVTITPDDAANTITIAASAGGIDHGTLAGLADDDHTQYFELTQSETVSGRPAFNGGTSGVDSPFTVDSTFVVTNLNADLLDGISEASFFRLNQNETVTGLPSFNGGTSGSTAPFYVDSTFLVTNFNADLLDGYHAADLEEDGCTDCMNATEIEDIYVLNTSDTMSGTLTALDMVCSGGDCIGSSDVAGLVAGDLTVNVVSSLSDGTTTVTNDGGNITIAAGGGVSVVANDGTDTITISASAAGIDHGGLGGLADDDHPQYFALAQNETVTGRPIFNDGVAFNGGTSGASSPFTVDSTWLVTNLNADLLDGQSGAYYLDDTTVGIDGVYNAGGNVDFVASGNITITPDNGVAKNVTFAVANNTLDHGLLLGLADNDHPQYVLDGCTDCLNATEIADVYVLNSGGDTMSGGTYNITYSAANANVANFNGNTAADSTYEWVGFYSDNRKGIILWDGAWNECGTDSFCITSENGNSLYLDSIGTIYMMDDVDFNNEGITNIDWSTSDDGSGSGLDADMVDGLHAGDFCKWGTNVKIIDGTYGDTDTCLAGYCAISLVSTANTAFFPEGGATGRGSFPQHSGDAKLLCCRCTL